MSYHIKEYSDESSKESTFYKDVNDGKIKVQLKTGLIKPEKYGNRQEYDLRAINTDGTHTYNVKLIGNLFDVVVEGPLSLTQLKVRWDILFDGPTGGKKTRRHKSKRRRQRKMRSRKYRL